VANDEILEIEASARVALRLGHWVSSDRLAGD